MPASSFPFPYLSPYRLPKRRARSSSRPQLNLAALPQPRSAHIEASGSRFEFLRRGASAGLRGTAFAVGLASEELRELRKDHLLDMLVDVAKYFEGVSYGYIALAECDVEGRVVFNLQVWYRFFERKAS